jgi:GntR family transcriptional regulator
MPLYHQLKQVLRRQIEAGRPGIGEMLPPERELIEQFGISRITVRQALTELESEGLLVRRHGKGTFVAPPPVTPIAETLSELTGHLEELQRQGLDPQVEVLALEQRAMPDDVADTLERPRGAAGWYLYRLVRVGGQPLMLTEAYLPLDLDLPLDYEVLRRKGLAPLLSEHGLDPVKGSQRIGAQLAGAAGALLELGEGDAVLRVERVICSGGGQPLVRIRTLYRADRYEYEVELKRRR